MYRHLCLYEQQVRQFFDRIAGSYGGRYSDPRYHGLLAERLRLATAGLHLEGKTVLDIGAGTGPLFDYLTENVPAFRYFACDLSSAMLEQSRIPVRARFIGPVFDHPFPVRRFDVIFMLGVTTYMPPVIVKEHLAFIARSLMQGGMAVLSFTHRHSPDFRFRAAIRPLVRLVFPNRGLLGQQFPVYAYTLEDLDLLLPSSLRIARSIGYNPAIPAGNWIFPDIGGKIAHRLSCFFPFFGRSLFLYTDFLVFLLYRG